MAAWAETPVPRCRRKLDFVAPQASTPATRSAFWLDDVTSGPRRTCGEPPAPPVTCGFMGGTSAAWTAEVGERADTTGGNGPAKSTITNGVNEVGPEKVCPLIGNLSPTCKQLTLFGIKAQVGLDDCSYIGGVHADPCERRFDLRVSDPPPRWLGTSQ